jgi:two-component system CheB/CheR fusion protein
MRVVQVSEAVKVEPNFVYVIPPGKNLLMADGQLVLNDLRHENGKRSAVDIFFRTLAETHGPRSVAIVLSSADGDGAIGKHS